MEENIFIPAEDKVEINLHDMQVDEAKYYLEMLLNTAAPNIKQVTVIHGYKKGQALLNMVRKDFKHPKLGKKVIPYNKGITIFYLN